ncbi:MAG: putative LPS assembly protein LptD [Chitinophagaceae bacterium]
MLICSITSFASGNYTPPSFFYTTKATTVTDTVPAVKSRSDTIPANVIDTAIKKVQVTDTIDVKISKDSLDAPVTYSASDSMVLDVPSKKITLFNQSSTKYKDLDLSAFKIEMDQEKQIIVASYTRDSAGSLVGRPKFLQGENNMDSDSIIYNIKTQKGITSSTYTTQGEMYVFGERIKKISENEYFALRGRFTTCNLDTPHFAFVTKRLKLVNKKLAISGPIHPEFEGVPVPIYIPFGFFPLSQGRHSGLLPPQFTANEQFGLGLEGLGYYEVLNDNFDVTLRSDIYSYGGYRLNLTPTYRKRYRYQGQFNLAYQNTRFLSDAGDKEYESNRSFNIYWNHSVDSKARPGTSFSANVNAGSTKFNRYVANNPTLNFQNQLNSSINYSKNWDNKYNMTISANHNQNNNTRLVNLSLPNISFTATNFYPFQKKEFVGEPKWYEKLGIGLNSNVAGQASFYDSLFSFRQLIDTFQWGAQHNVPITLSLPALGPFQVAPGISYQEKWYAQRFIRQWNGNSKKIDTVINKGFFTARDVSFSLGVNTAIFGTFAGFGKNSRIKAIRHVIRPNISANYKPDLAKKDYYSTQIDTTGREFRFSPYDGTIYGAFGEGRFGGISFGVDNNLEMKVRSKTDTTEGSDSKIKLIDGFGFNGGYNFLADSFKLSIFNVYLRSTLFEKINITAGAVIDPYVVDASGFRQNRYVWQDGKYSLGRLTNGNIAISTSFRSKEKEKKKEEPDQQYGDQNLPMTMEEQQAQLNYIRKNPAEFADFNIPWSINVSYSLSFSRNFLSDYSGFKTEINSNVSLNGDFNLTPKWKMGMNTYYDFKTASIQSLSMFLSREMHCWQMSINVTPVGLYRSFNITINPKSSLLKDIRVNRSRYFYGGN